MTLLKIIKDRAKFLNKHYPIVYRGGSHIVRCDGKLHWCQPDYGDIWCQGKCWCKKMSIPN